MTRSLGTGCLGQEGMFSQFASPIALRCASECRLQSGMGIRFEEFLAIFRVCCYTNFILRSNMINLRGKFLQLYFSFIRCLQQY